MSPDEERDLVARAVRDPDALSKLYRHYFPRLYAYARYRVSQEVEAEEVVAETFLKVVENLERFRWRHEQSFAAWLFRIARNVLADQGRRSRRADVVPLVVAPELPSRALPLEDQAVQGEEVRRLHGLLGELAPRHREVTTLRFFGGLRNREIARVLEVDERTVAAYLCRGLEDLHRRHLEAARRPALNQGVTHECAG
jgi:RNA polymerase sigma-70 factor (ECF subfamily)